MKILLDDEYKHILDDYSPYVHLTKTTCYVRLYKSGKMILLHRLIMKAPRDKQVDHINGNGLDNRKVNLRLCTRSQNAANTNKYVRNKSGYKGVSWDKSKNKWKAQITKNKKTITLLRSDDPIKAANAYDTAALKYHKEFAVLNFKR